VRSAEEDEVEPCHVASAPVRGIGLLGKPGVMSPTRVSEDTGTGGHTIGRDKLADSDMSGQFEATMLQTSPDALALGKSVWVVGNTRTSSNQMERSFASTFTITFPTWMRSIL
jgi:hypothetical protein